MTPAFARRCGVRSTFSGAPCQKPWGHHDVHAQPFGTFGSGRRREHPERVRATTWLTASRARAMAGRSAIVETVAQMTVARGAWHPATDGLFTMRADDGVLVVGLIEKGRRRAPDRWDWWVRGSEEIGGCAESKRVAMLLAQRYHAAHALSMCGSRTGAGR